MNTDMKVSAQKSSKTDEELSQKAEDVIRKMIDKYLLDKKGSKIKSSSKERNSL